MTFAPYKRTQFNTTNTISWLFVAEFLPWDRIGLEKECILALPVEMTENDPSSLPATLDTDSEWFNAITQMLKSIIWSFTTYTILSVSCDSRIEYGGMAESNKTQKFLVVR